MFNLIWKNVTEHVSNRIGKEKHGKFIVFQIDLEKCPDTNLMSAPIEVMTELPSTSSAPIEVPSQSSSP